MAKTKTSKKTRPADECLRQAQLTSRNKANAAKRRLRRLAYWKQNPSGHIVGPARKNRRARLMQKHLLEHGIPATSALQKEVELIDIQLAAQSVPMTTINIKEGK